MANYKKEDLPNLVGREFQYSLSDGVYKLLNVYGDDVALGKGKKVYGESQNDLVRSYDLLPEIPEGFTRHFGGECPVDGDIGILVAFDDGEKTDAPLAAGTWDWDGSIIAYRVIEQEKPKELDISEYWQVVYGNKARNWLGGEMYETKKNAEFSAKFEEDVIGYKQVGSNIVELV